MPDGRNRPISLRRLLTAHFSDGELRTLCFDLSLEYDELPGQGSSEKAREIVAFLERRDRIADLIAVGKYLRPELKWDEFHQDPPQSITPPNDNFSHVSQAKLQVSPHNLSPEARFWYWFEMHSEQLKKFESPCDPILIDLSEELTRVADGLTYEFSYPLSFGREFIVSADGKRSLFSAVIRLVGSAPTLPGWKFIAFRQSKDVSFTLQMNSFFISTDDILFAVTPNSDLPERLDVVLYFAGLTQRNKKLYREATFPILDAVLGEYDVETKVGLVDVQRLPKDPQQINLRPLHELQHVIKNWEPA